MKKREAELAADRERLTRVTSQLTVAKQLYDQTWSCGYSQGLERVRGASGGELPPRSRDPRFVPVHAYLGGSQLPRLDARRLS